MDFLAYSIVAVVSYFLGSIPTGYLVARAKGVDIRNLGSKNIGATNVFRVLGKGPGTVVLLIDALKGYAACQWASRWAMRQFGSGETQGALNVELLAIVAGVFAILGHNYTCWLKFKGGKGVATTGGVMLGLVPLGLVISLGVWILVLALSRYVSLASVAAAISLPFAAWISGASVAVMVFFALVGALGIYKHKPNIQRLLNGTESRFGIKKPSVPGSS